jgi:Holliday junction resolvase RusA-like endonuclease
MLRRCETIICDLRPTPAPRPRITRWGAYNDPKYTAHKKQISEIAKRFFKEPMQGALRMGILFQFKKTKSWTKKKKREAYWHTQKPDADNLAKTVKDALNQIAYKDDSQICDLDVVKIWGDTNKIVIELEEI